MATSKPDDVQFLTAAINHEIQQRVAQIMEKEIKAAKENVEKQMRGAVDSIALSLCSEYTIERDARHIIITARKLI